MTWHDPKTKMNFYQIKVLTILTTLNYCFSYNNASKHLIHRNLPPDFPSITVLHFYQMRGHRHRICRRRQLKDIVFEYIHFRRLPYLGLLYFQPLITKRNRSKYKYNSNITSKFYSQIDQKTCWIVIIYNSTYANKAD